MNQTAKPKAAEATQLPGILACLDVPDTRQLLYVQEVAGRLCVTDKHVGDLVEEGEFEVLNVGGLGFGWVQVPPEFFTAVSKASGISEKKLLQMLRRAREKSKALNPPRRRFWRVTVQSYRAFLLRRFTPAAKSQAKQP
ncbi:MAG: hypothetical protein JWQ71_3743 [Pedosphaera sp.]|nr:hypothetical protein [Pedosphaera sp.]